MATANLPASLPVNSLFPQSPRRTKKIASLDPAEEVNCADKARLMPGARHHNKLADLLLVAGLACSAFYYQCQAIQRADQQSVMEARIRTVYD
ncbi:hypothetical protein [Stutzerimonas kirkiae]|uniref:hypothetical protein n=1 Tax=Stutzerimonas kirkiae TaxID=2211392 RepID=UPI0013F14FA2|nr:hypothetical protein [Stutzerimonas kirkiae]